ncbi:MAG: hypothetical protein PWQ86_1387 [Bacillota bacterium]|nr:hypothetical protein [Bacillota bacterium]
MQTTGKRLLKGDDGEDARTEGIFEEELKDLKTQTKYRPCGLESLRSGEEKRRTKKPGRRGDPR